MTGISQERVPRSLSIKGGGRASFDCILSPLKRVAKEGFLVGDVAKEMLAESRAKYTILLAA